VRALEDIVDHHRLVRAVEGTDPQVHDARSHFRPRVLRPLYGGRSTVY
jgi:hypothetical protein